MDNQYNIDQKAAYFRELEGRFLEIDEDKIIKAYEDNRSNQSGTSVRILTITGGILASLAFLGFAGVLGLFDLPAGMIITGILFLGISFFLNNSYNKVLPDTLSITTYLIALLFVSLGLGQYDLNDNIVPVLLILIGIVTIFLFSNYILTFVAVLIVHGGICALIMLNEIYGLFHVYVSLWIVLTAILFLYEAEIVVKKSRMLKDYDALRIGSIFALISGLVVLSVKDLLPLDRMMIPVSSLVAISAVFYLIFKLTREVNEKYLTKKYLLLGLILVVLAPTILSPGIGGSLLLVLLCFYVNYRTGFVIGIISFLYFIFQFYYDLSFTLLIKSMLLIFSGLFFLCLYFLTSKMLVSDEKV